MSPLSLPPLAGALRHLGPSCGPVRLVAVDGHAGSGKSTFARCLAGALGGAPVLPLDAIATHEEFFSWTGRLLREVIDPLRQGHTAHYRPYDWEARIFGTPLRLAPAPVVLVEGVGAGRAALRPWLARVLWLDTPREEAWRRGRRRDGPGLAAFWDDWVAAERRHFAADPSRPFAHHVVRQCNVGPEGPEGPEILDDAKRWIVLDGPAVTSESTEDVTQGDGRPPGTKGPGTGAGGCPNSA